MNENTRAGAMTLPRYSTKERDRRWELARRVMKEENVDALLIYGEREGTSPAPFSFDTYFTNDRPGAVVVFPRKGEPVSLVPLPTYVGDHFESSLRGEAVWIKPENFRVARHPGGIAEALREHDLEKSAIGVVGLDPYPPYHLLPILPAVLGEGLARELPRATFKPVGHPLARKMMPQSQEELSVVRHAARIGDAIAQAMRDAALPGAPESFVYAAGVVAALELGAMPPGMFLWSGRESLAWGPPAWTYRPQESRRLSEGDMILGEVFVLYGMKETRHPISIAVGDVNPDFLKAEQVARDSYESGLDALRPGRRFGDVAKAMLQPIEKAGAAPAHPVLCGINPFGAVSGVTLAIGEVQGTRRYGLKAEIPPILDDLEIENGMTFSFEPSCLFGRRGVNLGGTVVVSGKEPVELNQLTSRLLHANALSAASTR
ncbi:MAG: M24 family metallopeptidase [Thermoanaerobaculia bacterium]